MLAGLLRSGHRTPSSAESEPSYGAHLQRGKALGIPAVAAAFAAAALFAGGSALQRRAAGAAAADETGIRLVARLARRPAWLIGLLLSAGAFSMYGVALRLGKRGCSSCFGEASNAKQRAS
jgi:hypothetical protein